MKYYRIKTSKKGTKEIIFHSIVGIIIVNVSRTCLVTETVRSKIRAVKLDFMRRNLQVIR